RCLQKDPGRRYAGARELAEDLQAYLEGRPVKARPDTLLTRVLRAVRQEPHPGVLRGRRRAEVVKACLSLAVCVLGTALVLLGLASPWAYLLLAVGGAVLVFWAAPRPDDTLVERQVSSVWRAFLIGSLVTALLNVLMPELRPLRLAPVVAVLAGVAH